MQNYNSKFKTIFLILTFNFALLTFNLSEANATELSLSVSPPLLQIEAIPPASIQAPITIQNLSDTSAELDILFKPFIAKDSEDGTPRYLTKDEPFPGANPLIFEKMQIRDAGHNIKSVLLAPRQEKKLILHIGIPKDETLSDYYFSIVFVHSPELVEGSTPDSEERDASLTKAAGGIATNVLLSIGPKGQAKGFLEEFSAPNFHEIGPVPFTVRIKNTSSQYITPEGQIVIKNMFGQLIGHVDLLQVAILAHSIRAIPDSLQSPDATPSPTTTYNLQPTNSPKAYWPESFLLGPYSATLTIALSETGPRYIKTIHFIGFPSQAVIAVILSLILILVIKDRLDKRLQE